MDVTLCAHRGMSKDFPENTMPAFEAMLDAGISYLECDLCLTKDEKIIIHHDANVGRTSDGEGPVRQHLLTDLEKLDAGSWKAKRFARTHIPPLTELLNWAMAHQILCNLEVKLHQDADRMIMLDRLQEACMGLDQDLLVFSSFDIDLLHEFRRRDDNAKLIPIHGSLHDQVLLDAERIQAQTIHMDGHLLTKEDAERIIAEGLSLGCYTINDPNLAQILVSWGVSVIISDCPDQLGLSHDPRHD
ncbi:MAG TPA: hypothetical protein DHV03_01115 [Alphaproteobacteria bacterium]|nr:hypothetical protein [Alphaproteobacteria bacterium]